MSRINIFRPLRRWAALIQLAFLEANSRGAKRFNGMWRVRRVGAAITLWAVAPTFALAAIEALGLRRSVLWWVLAGLAIGWGLFLLAFMLTAMTLSVFRAARLRLATDREGLRKYPRYPRRPSSGTFG